MAIDGEAALEEILPPGREGVDLEDQAGLDPGAPGFPGGEGQQAEAEDGDENSGHVIEGGEYLTEGRRPFASSSKPAWSL